MRGFGGFAPELSVGVHDSGLDIEDQPRDVTVMTYHAFRIAVAEGKISDKDFDIMFADEAHYLMGPMTRQARRQFCRNRIPVYGVTASGDYGVTRPLTEVLKHKICDIDFRSEIEDGNLPPIQLIRVKTDRAIKVNSRTGDYSEKELHGLAHDDYRNQRVIDWVEHLVSNGRHVFVPCIRGDSAWHAYHLAEMANFVDAGTANARERLVYDPKIDDYRPFKAVAVSSRLSTIELNQILEDWEAGIIDALFTVGMFGVGFDSSRIDALVDAAPTGSEVVAEQRVGRLTRFSKEWPVKLYISLLDEVIGHKPQYTPWHVLGEEYIDHDMVIGDPRDGRRKYEGQPGRNRRPRRPKDDGRIQTDLLPYNLRDTLGDDYVLIEEVTITKRAEAYEAPPQDFVPLADHYDQWKGLDVASLSRLLANNGYPTLVALGRRGPMRHVHKDGISFLSAFELPPIAPKGYESSFTAGPQAGLSDSGFRSIATQLDITPVDMRTRKNRQIRSHYSAADINRVKAEVKQRRTLQAGDTPIRQIAKEAGLNSVTSVILKMADVEPPIRGEHKLMPSGQTGIVVNGQDASFLRRYYNETLITAQNKRQTIAMMVERSGRSRSSVSKAIRELGLTDRMQIGRYLNPNTGQLMFSKFLEDDHAEQVFLKLAGYDNPGNVGAVGTASSPAENGASLRVTPLVILETMNCTPMALRLLLARTATASDFITTAGMRSIQ